MKYFKLYEEFNQTEGKKFVEKLVIYSKAGRDVTKVSSVKKNEYGDYYFEFSTTQPGDFVIGGKKSFRVYVPTNIKDFPYVDTYEGGRRVFNASLEPKGEHDPKLILINFIEATNLYDDSVTQDLADAYEKVNSVEDVKNIIKTQDVG
jgi:hypothetical protein